MAKRRTKYNINVIRAFIYKRYKKRFGIKDWPSSLNVARDVLHELQDNDLRPNQKNMTIVVNTIRPPKKRTKKLPDPLIPDEYITNPTPFWETNKLIKLISQSDSRISFRSNYIFEPGQRVQGGTVLNYDENGEFKQWVLWTRQCSKLQNSYKQTGGDSYAPYWRVAKQPQLIRGIWEAMIINCDAEGNETEFEIDTYETEEHVIPEKHIEPEKPVEPKIEKEKEPEISPIEKEKVKGVKLENLIKYKESLQKDIDFYEKHKRNTDALWARYDKVEKQIEDLMS